MKKNKKFNEVMPVIETKPAHEPGSVGEFIEILKNFPSDSKFDLNGSAHIDNIGIINDDGTPVSMTIHPIESVYEDDYDTCESDCDYCDCCEYEEESVEDRIMKAHLFGYDDIAKSMRGTSSDHLTDALIMNPNKHELDFEMKELHPHQIIMIDEIREQNVYMVESLTEAYRRQLSALLEYNTQCMAHLAANTNRVMCEIVNNKK